MAYSETGTKRGQTKNVKCWSQYVVKLGEYSGNSIRKGVDRKGQERTGRERKRMERTGPRKKRMVCIGKEENNDRKQHSFAHTTRHARHGRGTRNTISWLGERKDPFSHPPSACACVWEHACIFGLQVCMSVHVCMRMRVRVHVRVCSTICHFHVGPSVPTNVEMLNKKSIAVRDWRTVAGCRITSLLACRQTLSSSDPTYRRCFYAWQNLGEEASKSPGGAKPRFPAEQVVVAASAPSRAWVLSLRKGPVTFAAVANRVFERARGRSWIQVRSSSRPTHQPAATRCEHR